MFGWKPAQPLFLRARALFAGTFSTLFFFFCPLPFKVTLSRFFQKEILWLIYPKGYSCAMFLLCSTYDKQWCLGFAGQIFKDKFTYQGTALQWRSSPAPQAHSLHRRWLRSLSASTWPWIEGLSRWRWWWWAWWCCSGTTRCCLPVVSPQNIPLPHPGSLVCPQVSSRSGPGECKRSRSPLDLSLYQEALWDKRSNVVWCLTTQC